MKRAVITVGLGFGDEGKGATVDFLTRELDADLVIRYCGGSQAGHNVELPGGQRHTFSQFGAGTLAPQRPSTYLGSAVVIDPPALLSEAAHLTELGVPNPLSLVTVHPDALVTTPWLKLLNRVREIARGGAKHGSCGQGIGETRHYWIRYGADAVTARDLLEPDALHAKLELQRQRVLLELQPLREQVPADALGDIGIDVWDTHAAEQLRDPALALVTISPDVPDHRTAILEGAQGVLLDEYRGFHPYTTWSTVTPRHAWELIDRMGSEAVAVLGITRAYTTRHGDGPFPTFSPELTELLRDPGNPWNRWQGTIRSGWLDLPLLRYAASVCGKLDGLVVNHLDQIAGDACRVCETYLNAALAPSALPDLAWQSRLTELVRTAEPVLAPAAPASILGTLAAIAPVTITGSGPVHTHRTFTSKSGLTFRRKRI